MRSTTWILAIASTIALTSGVATSAFAQYKWVGADGRINYSDVPPPAAGKLLRGPNGTPLASALNDSPNALPYALQQAVSKYPVTLFTTPDCSPCKSAREVLAKRGVPYSEKSITTTVDAEQFKKLGFAELSLPSISVGKERSIGFEVGAYERLLDAAGYPRSSMLPASYKPGAVEALAKSGPNKMEMIDPTKTASSGSNNSGGNSTSADASKDTEQDPAAQRRQQRLAERAKMQAATQMAEQNPSNLRF